MCIPIVFDKEFVTTQITQLFGRTTRMVPVQHLSPTSRVMGHLFLLGSGLVIGHLLTHKQDSRGFTPKREGKEKKKKKKKEKKERVYMMGTLDIRNF